MISHLVFDVVSTLLRPTMSIGETYASIGRKHGSSLDAGQIRVRFAKHFRRIFQPITADENESAATTSHQQQKSLWQALVQAVFVDASDECDDADKADSNPNPDVEQIFSQLWSYYACPTSWQLFPDVDTTFAMAVERNLNLVLASNFDDRLFQIVDELPPINSAHHIFSSSQVGFDKPDLRFYQVIETKLGVKGSNILMIGDSPENDFLGPIRAGWSALWLNRKNESTQFEESSEIDSQRTISSLPELFQHL